MRRLGWCVLLSLCWACDSSDSSSGDASTLLSDTSTLEVSVDQGITDGALADVQTTTDAQPEMDVQVVDAMPPEPDASLREICTPLGRCNDRGGWCESAEHPECWRGEAPACFDSLHPLSRANCPEGPGGSAEPACVCPDGYQVGPGEDICARATSRRAAPNPTTYNICRGPRAATYGAGGARFENTDGDDANDAVLDSYWGPMEANDRDSGRLNQVGIWACDWQVRDQSGFDPINEWIGVSHCLSVDAPGDYLLGVAADDQVRIKLNGQVIFESPAEADATAHWHVRRVALNSGINVIEFYGRNTGNVGALGAQISGPFEHGSLAEEAQQKAADYAGNIVFSTETLVDAQFHLGEESGFNCREETEVVNTCRAPTRCTTIEKTPCEAPPLECPAGQHPEGDLCVRNACTCVFGAPAVGEECPVDGAALCIGCVQGYYLSEGVCLENECGCDNGFAAHSAACTENGAQMCLFCDDGYRLEDSACLPNQCTCEQGVGTTGPLCPVDGEALCADCNEGLHVEDGACVPNQCLCRNGVFDENAPCPEHRGDVCSSCDEGYHLEGSACLSNLCICEHGNRAFGPDCLVNGAVWCTGCMDGYRLIEGQCVPQQCSCINGTGAQGADCPREGALRCAECNEGYRLDGNVCVQSDCRCANGQPSIGDACPGVGVNHCASCNQGYQLVDDACAANACSCANGQEAIGLQCPGNGVEQCINCDQGYRLQDGACEPQNCECEFGVGAVGPACPREGAVLCVACDGGYRLENDVCVLIPEPTCDDNIQNADESDVDCGGHCAPCGDGQRCGIGAECISEVCVEGVCQPPRCGDGVINGQDVCDDGDNIAEPCPYGDEECQVCGVDCSFVAGQTSVCGDANVDGANGEACDDGNLVQESCEYGQEACQVCDGQCALVAGATSLCGDGVTDAANGETCDDGNVDEEACPYGAPECQVCGRACTEVPGQTSFCGDGITDVANGEACDDGNDDDTDGCRNRCALPACDDGVLNGDETDVDCGGGCGACDDGLVCRVPEDCVSGRCRVDGGPVDPGVCEDAAVLGGANHEQQPREQGWFNNDGRTLAVEYIVPDGPDLVIDRVEFFTGSIDAVSEVSLWSNDPDRQLPGEQLASAAFTMTADYFGWDGGRFPRTFTLSAGERYWVGLKLMGGRPSFAQEGDSVRYTGRPIGADNWENVFENPVMFRVVRCGGGGAGAANGCGADDPDCVGVCAPLAVCGDEVIEGEEVCDDGNALTEACPYGQEACEVCDAQCRLVDGETSFCGDGDINAGNNETCDDSNRINEACPYGDQNCVVCGDKCTLVAGQTSFCGDGDIDVGNGEECDDSNLQDGDGCSADCRVEECQGCGCGVDACEIGDRAVVIDTLNYDGMSFRPVDLDDCYPGPGNIECCPGSTKQEQLNAFCRLAGFCRAVGWDVDEVVGSDCYMIGECTNCRWFRRNACEGSVARNYIMSVTCQ